MSKRKGRRNRTRTRLTLMSGRTASTAIKARLAEVSADTWAGLSKDVSGDVEWPAGTDTPSWQMTCGETKRTMTEARAMLTHEVTAELAPAKSRRANGG